MYLVPDEYRNEGLKESYNTPTEQFPSAGSNRQGCFRFILVLPIKPQRLKNGVGMTMYGATVRFKTPAFERQATSGTHTEIARNAENFGTSS